MLLGHHKELPHPEPREGKSPAGKRANSSECCELLGALWAVPAPPCWGRVRTLFKVVLGSSPALGHPGTWPLKLAQLQLRGLPRAWVPCPPPTLGVGHFNPLTDARGSTCPQTFLPLFLLLHPHLSLTLSLTFCPILPSWDKTCAVSLNGRKWLAGLHLGTALIRRLYGATGAAAWGKRGAGSTCFCSSPGALLGVLSLGCS